MAREEAAVSGSEGYEGKESKSICSGGRSLNWGSPTRNWATWRGAVHISPGARSVGWVGQLKKWAPCGRWSGIRGRRGHRPSQRSDVRTGASSTGRNGAGRGRCVSPWTVLGTFLLSKTLKVNSEVLLAYSGQASTNPESPACDTSSLVEPLSR